MKKESEMLPQEMNAQYIVIENKMNIPAGILQPPFFSSGIPDYVNYGGVGSIIGHIFQTISLEVALL